jgi:hypothetical protein
MTLMKSFLKLLPRSGRKFKRSKGTQGKLLVVRRTPTMRRKEFLQVPFPGNEATSGRHEMKCSMSLSKPFK